MIHYLLIPKGIFLVQKRVNRDKSFRQTFLRRPFAASLNFCHPALKGAAIGVGEHTEQVRFTIGDRNCENLDIVFDNLYIIFGSGINVKLD